jgi:hypothetical protein
VLLRVAGEEAVVELTITHEGCDSACVLPRAALERVVLHALRAEHPGLGRVVLLDPRDEQAKQ